LQKVFLLTAGWGLSALVVIMSLLALLSMEPCNSLYNAYYECYIIRIHPFWTAALYTLVMVRDGLWFSSEWAYACWYRSLTNAAIYDVCNRPRRPD